MHARGEQRLVVELGQHGMRREKLGHLRVEIHQRDAIDLGIFQDFANGEAITAAENQDAARSRNGRKAGMNQSFVVAVFVARAELQVAVEKETQIVLETRENQMLVTRIAGEDDFIGVNIVLCGGRDVPGFRDAGAQSAEHHQAGDAQTTSPRELAGENKSAPKGDGGINQAKEHRRTNQPETRHEQNGKQEGRAKRTEIVESQNVRDDIPKMITILYNAHQQRDFQPHQSAHYDDQGIEDQFEALREREREHQQRRREAANHAEKQLNPHKAVHESAMDIARERAADSHGEQVSADDRRELKHAVTDEVTRQSAGHELVNEPARRYQ